MEEKVDILLTTYNTKTAVYEPSAMLLAIVDKVVASPDAHW